jgi:hypothetical protein
MQLLPKDIAKSSVDKFNDDTLPQQDRINAATGLILSTKDPVQQRAIFEQLVKEGLPDATEGAVAAYARGDDGAGRRLMQAAITDPSKLPGKAPNTPSEISDAIQSKLMDEGQIGDIYYGLSDGTTENQERAIRDGKLLTNTVNLRLRNGETLNDAIASASKDLYGDVKPVTGDGRVGAQIIVPADTDPQPILDGLNGLLPTVRASILPVHNASAPTGHINGRVESGNLDLTNRPQVKNDDGSVSTVRSISFNEDGLEVLIPTVSSDGRVLSDDDAIDLYRRTGEHLGKFDTPENATAFAEKLHTAQEEFYSNRSTGRSAVMSAASQNYANNVIAQGYFRNGGSGYVFIDPFVGAAVSGADGKPLTFTEEQVMQAGQSSTAKQDPRFYEFQTRQFDR